MPIDKNDRYQQEVLKSSTRISPRILSMVLWVIACALPAYESGGPGAQSVSGVYCFVFGALGLLPIPVGLIGINSVFEATGWLANVFLLGYCLLGNSTARTNTRTAFILLAVGFGLSLTALFVNDLDIMHMGSRSADPGGWHPAIGAYVWVSSFAVPLILYVIKLSKSTPQAAVINSKAAVSVKTDRDTQFRRNDHTWIAGVFLLALALAGISIVKYKHSLGVEASDVIYACDSSKGLQFDSYNLSLITVQKGSRSWPLIGHVENGYIEPLQGRVYSVQEINDVNYGIKNCRNKSGKTLSDLIHEFNPNVR